MPTKKTDDDVELSDEEREYEALTPAQKRVRQPPAKPVVNSTMAERRAKRIEAEQTENKRVSKASTK